ncbi:MAG: hypothetical protein Q8K98_06030 [Bacteroidota bacterium]|nr:hypothetical protein [Bacteroidota bacterium]
MQTKNFKQVITSFLQPFPKPDAVNGFVHLCHKMAVAYLRTKFLSNKYSENRFGINIDDLALDVIADIFARDNNGKFVEIHKYFKQFGNLSVLSDDELFAGLRRLVFSATNVRFFNIYGEFDPALSKIIRNIKLTLKDHTSVKVIVHNEENFLAPRQTANLLLSLPFIPEEILSPEFYDRVSSKSSLRDMLTAIGNVLEEQKNYKKIASLTEVAVLIKEAYASDAIRKMGDEEFSAEEIIFNDQIKSIAQEVVSNLKTQYLSRYIEKEKLSKIEIAAIFKATEEILINQFCSGNGDPASYYATLQKQLRDLNKEIYSGKYRVILEYLSKLAKNQMSDILKEELK